MKLINSLLIAALVLIFIITACDKEISTTSPDPDPQRNTIKVISNPVGYDIYLNGKITGKHTPDSITYLDPASYQIGLKHPLYLDTSLNVTVGNEETKELEIDLTHLVGFYSTLKCISNPTGAEIIVNDSATGVETPGIISGLFPKEYSVKVKKTGYRSKELEVILKSSEEKQMNFNLEDTTIWLVYNNGNSNFPTNSLHCIGTYLNVEERIWVGTDDAGAVDISSPGWPNYSTGNSLLPSNYVTAIGLFSKNISIVGTMEGIYLDENGTTSLITTSNSNISSHAINAIFHIPPQTSSVNGNVIVDEKLYLGTEGGGLLVYKNGLITSEALVSSKLPSQYINCITGRETFGSVFRAIGTDEGLYVENDYTGLQRIYNTSNAGFFTNQITAIDHVGGTYNLYVGVKQSSIMYPPVGRLYYQESDDSWLEINLDGAVVNAIVVNFSDVWVATNNGLYLIRNKTQVVKHYNNDNSPLPSDNINDVKLDKSNNLWMATGKGLVRYKEN